MISGDWEKGLYHIAFQESDSKIRTQPLAHGKG